MSKLSTKKQRNSKTLQVFTLRSMSRIFKHQEYLWTLDSKNAAQRTSQRVKWTSGARITIISFPSLDRSIARSLARSLPRSLAWFLYGIITLLRKLPTGRVCIPKDNVLLNNWSWFASLWFSKITCCCSTHSVHPQRQLWLRTNDSIQFQCVVCTGVDMRLDAIASMA